MMDALLVDDSATMRLRLRRLLEAKPGVSVTDHADPAAALVEAQMRAFDLVLVDCHMPAMDGIAFIQRMRTIPHYAQVPDRDGHQRHLGRGAARRPGGGATDFLDKSMQGVELTVRLRNLIRLAKAVRRLAEQAAWLDGEVEAALRHMREREEEIIFRLALAVEYRDNDTGDHTWRVARYSQIVAEGLGLPPEALPQPVSRRAAARCRQGRHPGRHPAEARPARPGRVRPDQDACDHRPAHPGRQRLRADPPGRRDRRGAPREVGRQRLPEGARGRRDPPGGPDRRGGGRVRRPDHAAALQGGDVVRGGPGLHPGRERPPFRPGLRRGVLRALAGYPRRRRPGAGHRPAGIRPVTEPWARVPTLLREIAAEPPSPGGMARRAAPTQPAWDADR